MQRSALKSIGKSIAASAEEATLEDLKRTGKRKEWAPRFRQSPAAGRRG